MLLRVIAALVDFLIVFWVGLPLTPFFSEVARLLRDTLAREGTQRQKHYFSQLVTSEAKRKPEMRAVAASVEAW